MKQKIRMRIIDIVEKKKSGKGFTLVELIVVLVILAILAALLLPTLTKYIDRATEMRVESACRMAVMGVKAETAMMYGKTPGGADLTYYVDSLTNDEVAAYWKPAVKNIRELAEVDTDVAYVQAYFTPDAVVKKVVYKTATHTCTYENSGFTVKQEDYDLAKKGIALYFDGQTTEIYAEGDGEGTA